MAPCKCHNFFFFSPILCSATLSALPSHCWRRPATWARYVFKRMRKATTGGALVEARSVAGSLSVNALSTSAAGVTAHTCDGALATKTLRGRHPPATPRIAGSLEFGLGTRAFDLARLPPGPGRGASPSCCHASHTVRSRAMSAGQQAAPGAPCCKLTKNHHPHGEHDPSTPLDMPPARN